MEMHDPLHPGEFILEVYLRPQNISGRRAAAQLGVAASTFNRILNGQGRVSPAMAQILSRSLGRSAGSWLAMQEMCDRWQARQRDAA
ncbi:HigA family addiction module antitoxin [Duganella callida]|uniref:Addiction module antidote protein, HigA family n=1 Tax=Duganella callida TaxID=2561932 RepID=A0A4Y9SLE6_9BURK|nr:HigA family addiction module antitoxin [Duganella callida]TFW27261.1 addiction module antidote protein, HigA family [Duganella callida]